MWWFLIKTSPRLLWVLLAAELTGPYYRTDMTGGVIHLLIKTCVRLE